MSRKMNVSGHQLERMFRTDEGRRQIARMQEKTREGKKVKILVVCSNPRGGDFNINTEEREIFRKTFPLGDKEKEFFFMDPMYNDKMFPQDLVEFENFYFDFIWFAGCNLLFWIFDEEKLPETLERLREKLKDNGIIFFTEGPKYIKKTSGRKVENDQNLTINIGNMKYEINMGEGILANENNDFLDLWFQYFREVIEEDKFYYVKN